jgi:putative nucleotidyltransferase with HDIG domain
MSGKSPEWVNLMLDAVDPRKPAVSAALEKMTKRARGIATRRTQQLGQPDAHALRVANLAAETARRLDFSGQELEVVVEGALLHDLGKTLVPRGILEQCRPLTRAEYVTVMQHPVWGAALVKGFVSESVLLAIRHHHEWWNGKGYPQKLRGREIPFEARIVSIADVFDALTHQRRYKVALSVGRADEFIAAGRGTQFDPDLVDLFLSPPVRAEIKEAQRAQRATVRAARGSTRNEPRRHAGNRRDMPEVSFRWRATKGD